MDEIIKITKKLVGDFNDNIGSTMDSKSITNTGQAKQSLRVEFDEKSVRSLGINYIEILNDGRPPGKFAPVDNITEWVRTKLGITEEKELKYVSFLVNRKIATEGTEIYKDKSKGLQIDERVKALTSALTFALPKAAKIDAQILLNKFKLKTKTI